MNPDARDRYKGFHWGLDPRGVSDVEISPEPRELVKLGTLEAITYRTRKGGRDGGLASWEHHFGEDGGRKPSLAVDPDSDRLHIVGGDYAVEDRGIVD
jgi:hypothetical protein